MRKTISRIMLGLSLGVNLLVGVALLGNFHSAQADSGYEAATRREAGSYSVPYSTMVAATITQIILVNTKRPDLTCRNNTARALFIGGDSTTRVGNGFPVLSSETFTTGAFSGEIWGVCESGSCDVRCFSGLVR